MNTEKKIIIGELKKLIKKNSFIKDVWLYGNFKDHASDLDILIVYKNKIKKILFPKIIEDYILDGTIVYIPFKNRYDIFLFESLKIFSIKKNKIVNFKLSIQNRKFQLLTSFLERYYERRQNSIFTKPKKINGIVIRNIKSLIFSYETFYKYLLLNNKKFIKKNLLTEYDNIRKKYLKNKLTKKLFNNYIIKLKKFDKEFNVFSYDILEKEFLKINYENFSYFFLKKYIFSHNSSRNYEKVPKIFGIIYSFYSSQNLSLSKIIKKDFNTNQKLVFNDNTFKRFLRKKIKFINTAYLDLKSSGFKKGMYRFSWYLN